MRTIKALILLGGLGTRLRPLTCHIPKPLLPLVNRPSLNYQLDLLKKAKIKEVIFCTGYLSTVFKNYFTQNNNFGFKIYYMDEKTPLGTGGAIKNAQRLVDTTTVIFNGDILTDIDLNKVIEFHHKNNAVVTIVLIRAKDPTIYGLVETDKHNRIERFLEKPSWDEVTCNTINAGIYVFEPQILDYIPEGINYSLERGLFPLLLEKKERVYGYISNSYWLDIGTIEKYLQAHYDLLNGETSYKIFKYNQNLIYGPKVNISPSSRISGKVVLGSGTKIEQYVQITGLVSIGNNCIIRKGSQIIDSVILDDTEIGEGSSIEHAVISHKCKIEPHVIISPGSVIGTNSHITRYSKL